MTLEIAFIAKSESRPILTMNSDDGVSWTGNTQTPMYSGDGGGISATSFKNGVALCFSAESDRRVVLSNQPNIWSTQSSVSNAVFGTLCEFNGILWMAFTDYANNLNICNSVDGIGWSDGFSLARKCNCLPALAVFNNRLFMAYLDDQGQFVITSSADGLNWATSLTLNEATNDSPALAAHKGELILVFVAANSSGSLLVCRSQDGEFWTGNSQIGQTTNSPPGLVSDGNSLHVAFVAKNSTNTVLVCSSSDGQTWTGNTDTNQFTQDSYDVLKIYLRP